MKRNLTLFLLCAVAGCASAQSLKVVEKSTASPAAAKPSAAQVKVVAVPASGKPTPVSVKPVAKPAVAVVKTPAKPAVAVVPAKVAPKTPQPGTKPASAALTPSKPVVAVKAEPAKQAVAVKPVVVAKPIVAAHPAVVPTKATDPFSKKKTEPVAKAAPVPAPAKDSKKAGRGNVVAVNENKPTEEKKSEPKKISITARRDPFVSPVVHMSAVGSGCSSGKRCLAIDQIALKGVVRSENGMIAVVVNSLDKAYFLRENDPVFNGYVTKITPDSIIFKETFHDKLGKELTRDVTKTISRPAA